jgi:hypothetical protein
VGEFFIDVWYSLLLANERRTSLLSCPNLNHFKRERRCYESASEIQAAEHLLQRDGINCLVANRELDPHNVVDWVDGDRKVSMRRGQVSGDRKKRATFSSDGGPERSTTFSSSLLDYSHRRKRRTEMMFFSSYCGFGQERDAPRRLLPNRRNFIPLSLKALTMFSAQVHQVLLFFKSTTPQSLLSLFCSTEYNRFLIVDSRLINPARILHYGPDRSQTTSREASL